MVDLINKGDIKYTSENKILYNKIYPRHNLYPNKEILFLGGKNSIIINNEFSRRISNFLGIRVSTLQYGGYYGSGNYKELTDISYMESILEVYNTVKNESEIYIIGYSLGCYGAYYLNERDTVFLISPFYSLEKSLRNVISIKSFNLNELLKKKKTKKVIINTYKNDIVTPSYHLTDNFIDDGIEIIKRNGVHITGISDDLYISIKDYIDKY